MSASGGRSPKIPFGLSDWWYMLRRWYSDRALLPKQMSKQKGSCLAVVQRLFCSAFRRAPAGRDDRVGSASLAHFLCSEYADYGGAFFITSRRFWCYKKTRPRCPGKLIVMGLKKNLPRTRRFHTQMWVHMAENGICVPPPVNRHCAGGVAAAGGVERRGRGGPPAPSVPHHVGTPPGGGADAVTPPGGGADAVGH